MTKRGRKRIFDENEAIILLENHHLTCTEIADKLNVKYGSIHYFFKSRKIEYIKAKNGRPKKRKG